LPTVRADLLAKLGRDDAVLEDALETAAEQRAGP
jgi:hypothetical protein